MKVTAVSLWHMPLTSHQACHMADGKTCETAETVVVKIDADAQVSGWGEVCPIPHYLPAYARGVLPAPEEMAPVLIGGDPLGAEALTARLDRRLMGHVYAKSALDIAFWDITAKVANVPLNALLGGRQAQDMPLYHSITCIAPDEMARIARDAQATGITQFQVKLGADANFQTDIAGLRLVREAVGKGSLVYGDWNCAATRLDATRVARAVSDMDVLLEQPCTTSADCLAVRAASG